MCFTLEMDKLTLVNSLVLIAQLTQVPCKGYIVIAHVICCHGNWVYKHFIGSNTVQLWIYSQSP